MVWARVFAVWLGLCGALAQAESLVVFGGDSFAPTTYLVNGEPAGTLVDILKKVSEKTGDTYQVRLYPWKRAYEQSLRGDGAIVGLSRTPQRQEIFDYSEPIYHNELQLVVLKGKEFAFSGLADLKGRNLGGGLGVSYGAELDEAVEAGLFVMERDTDATIRLQKVLTGQLDAAIIGHGTAGLERLVQGNQRLVNRYDELSVLPKPLARDPLYLAATKTMKKRDVLLRFDRALSEIRRTGPVKASR